MLLGNIACKLVKTIDCFVHIQLDAQYLNAQWIYLQMTSAIRAKISTNDAQIEMAITCGVNSVTERRGVEIRGFSQLAWTKIFLESEYCPLYTFSVSKTLRVPPLTRISYMTFVVRFWRVIWNTSGYIVNRKNFPKRKWRNCAVLLQNVLADQH